MFGLLLLEFGWVSSLDKGTRSTQFLCFQRTRKRLTPKAVEPICSAWKQSVAFLSDR